MINIINITLSFLAGIIAMALGGWKCLFTLLLGMLIAYFISYMTIKENYKETIEENNK